MKKILTLMAVAAMAFTACSKEESTGTGDKQVRITPTIANPALTPASMSSGTRATDTDFELNDKVGLTITMTADGSAFVANKEMSFDGTDFKTEGYILIDCTPFEKMIFLKHISDSRITGRGNCIVHQYSAFFCT